MQATFVQCGLSIDYTPGADVAAGDVVVQGSLVGVAKQDIANGDLGALAIAGVFDFAKTAGGSTAITAGAVVYWDDTNNVVTTTSSGNTLLGKCVKAAADADTTCRCLLSQ